MLGFDAEGEARFRFGTLTAQQTPAKPQSQPILITGATAHLGNGEVIENSAIAFEDGKLTPKSRCTKHNKSEHLAN